jgi:hypothetical protein
MYIHTRIDILYQPSFSEAKIPYPTDIRSLCNNQSYDPVFSERSELITHLTILIPDFKNQSSYNRYSDLQ